MELVIAHLLEIGSELSAVSEEEELMEEVSEFVYVMYYYKKGTMLKKINITLPQNFSEGRGIRHHLWAAAVLAKVLILAIPAGLLHAAAAPGVDGDYTVVSTDEILNRYSAVTAVSGNVITVNDINELDDGGAGHYANENLSVGDMILIYQAQGATFDDNQNLPSYGSFIYNSAGRYEFALVAGVSGNDITVDSSSSPPYSCGGINNTYNVTNGNVQVVRVPQYASLTVDNGASVIAADWNGETGGLIVLLVQGDAVANGLIDASGSGFRGGSLDTTSLIPSLFVTHYVEDEALFGAIKGESILGDETDYDQAGGSYLRAAPANGGGGGNSHNAGGGGGANGNNGGTWTGRGLPDTSNSAWDNAWDLDDGTDHPGTPLPSNLVDGAGGGRGGYSYAAVDADATLDPPSSTVWAGNRRFNVGGWGGRPLNNDPATRLFLGGGGGAGDDNNFTGTAGANGGGLVIIGAGSLSGSGQILSNGDDAEDISLDYEDGAGGGGAGGSVVIQTALASGVTISATGGSGGDNGVIGQPTIHPNESFGPGGGGGGGYIAVDSGSGSLVMDVSGGANGQTASEALAEFLPNGATGGYDGGTSTADFSLPGCAQPTAITLSSIAIKDYLNWRVLLLVFLLMTAANGFLLKRR